MSNVYECFYKSRKVRISADSSYKAQLAAARYFKARKSYDVVVVLVEKNGEQVPLDPCALPGA